MAAFTNATDKRGGNMRRGEVFMFYVHHINATQKHQQAMSQNKSLTQQPAKPVCKSTTVRNNWLTKQHAKHICNFTVNLKDTALHRHSPR